VRLESALSEMRPRTDSARETKLRLILTRGGYPEPEVNGEIINTQGRVITHGDLVYRDYCTIVEYDGSQHASDSVQFGIDIRRLDDLMEAGWRVIRVDKSLLARRSVLFRKVTTALTAAGWQPSRPPR
jgi:very-short-patch-repair endonuclease